MATENGFKLKIENLTTGYGDMVVIEDVDMELKQGGAICVLGPNGAGKTTLLRSIMNVIPKMGGKVLFEGEDVTDAQTKDLALIRGIGYLPQERGVFDDLTVDEQLRLAGHRKGKKGSELEESLEELYSLFPVIVERREERARTLSGGETQMVSIAKVMIQDPDLLLVDELSLGLMPKMVKNIYENLQDIHSQGTEIIYTEQSVKMGLEISDYVYVIEGGTVRLEGGSDKLSEEEIRKVYFGEL